MIQITLMGVTWPVLVDLICVGLGPKAAPIRFAAGYASTTRRAERQMDCLSTVLALSTVLVLSFVWGLAAPVGCRYTLRVC